MNKSNIHLNHCISQIEKELGWGDSDNWKASEFELLREKILAKTGVNLSVSTLRRLWGKVKYESDPQPATLNALAQFLGFENYLGFTASLQLEKKNEPISEIHEHSGPSYSIFLKVGAILLGIVGLVGVFWGLTQTEAKIGELDPDLFSFSSQPVSEGIPNSVVFDFAVPSSISDSVFIQQSWDSSKKFSVESTQNQATSVYYYPGFYNAKLLVGNKIVKEHGLLIPSGDWLALVNRESTPIYFKKEEAKQKGTLGLTEENFSNEKIPLKPEVPVSSIYYVDDLGGLSSQNFSLKTRFRNTYSGGNEACKFSQLMILTKGAPFAFAFSIPGCTSELGMMLSEKEINGKKTDLSAFGVEHEKWIDLMVLVEDQKVSIYLGSTLAYEDSFKDDPGDIIGLAYHFKGTGEIDNVQLQKADGQSILEEEF